MAEPSKSTRPSRGKQAPEPDFSPFEDWLIDGPAGKWPHPSETHKKLSEHQQRIVADNARDLEDRDLWLNKVQAFEAALAVVVDETQRKSTRSLYHIRFDRHLFADRYKDFENYHFPCSLSFSGATFGDGIVLFDGATFGDGNVWFYEAVFGAGDVLFNKALFGEGVVSFERTNFGSDGFSFNRANLGSGRVVFTETKFGDGNVVFIDANFEASTFSAAGMSVSGSLFVQSSFLTAVSLNGLEVKGTASFSRSSFAEVPDFRDAKFDRPPDVANMDVPRPKLKGWNGRAVDTQDVAKFRKLKAMALAANDHEKDGEFFAGEMLAKRGTETTGFFGLLFNTIYWWLSDFGQSFVLPLLWLGVSFLSFAAACLYLIRGALTWTDRLWFAADYSFRNMLPLFGSLFRFAPAPKDHVSWYQKTYEKLATGGVDIDRLISLGIAQSLIGTVLLFLFLLALRNKFRLK